MEGALAWIGQIAEWIGRFFPRREILDTTEGAIKYSGFILPRALRVYFGGYDGDFRITTHLAGIHWYWPYSSKWSAHPIALQTDRMETQTIESKDGKSYMASGTISYFVRDLAAFVTQVHSPYVLVVDKAALALHDVLCDYDWADLQNEQRRGTLKTKLKNEAQKQLRSYGLEITNFQLNSLTRCRVLKISQSVAQEEN